jgi:hypothetical protein
MADEYERLTEKTELSYEELSRSRKKCENAERENAERTENSPPTSSTHPSGM